MPRTPEEEAQLRRRSEREAKIRDVDYVNRLLVSARAGDQTALNEFVSLWHPIAIELCVIRARPKRLDKAEAASAAWVALDMAMQTYKTGMKSAHNKTGKTALFKTHLGYYARHAIKKPYEDWRRQTGYVKPQTYAQLRREMDAQERREAEQLRALEDRLSALERWLRERRICERLVSERGSYFYNWVNQRKGTDRDDRKLAKMVWIQGQSRAYAAEKLGWDLAKVDRHCDRITKRLTGKTEAELLPPYDPTKFQEFTRGVQP